jgi:cytochrome P450
MEQLTPLTAAFAADPYTYYRALVSERPFYFDADIQMWVACGAAAVDAVLGEEALRVRPATQAVPPAMQGTVLGTVFSRLARMTDGAAHGAYRTAITEWLQQREARAYEIACAAAAQRVRELPDDAKALNDYIFEGPAAAMAQIAGIPDNAQVRDAIHCFAAAIGRGADAPDIARGDSAAQYILSLLPSMPPVLAANILGLFFQNYDATAALTGAILSGSGDETPVHNTRRYAASPTSIFGNPIREGDTVLVVLAAAHRDPAATRSYAFGAGPHACPGSKIALTIATACTGALGSSLPHRRITIESYRPLPNVRIPVFASAYRDKNSSNAVSAASMPNRP